MSESTKQVSLRLPAALHRQLQQLADANDRSITSEIFARVASTLPGGRPLAEVAGSAAEWVAQSKATESVLGTAEDRLRVLEAKALSLEARLSALESQGAAKGRLTSLEAAPAEKPKSRRIRLPKVKP
ncbi:MAG: Arc family DNA-binding protein [Paracoccus sp. (in: a-proteobacteria)]|nr:Arc family DNA-binding protein [Paracoccus sp. (in: a-proteobacteria)]